MSLDLTNATYIGSVKEASSAGSDSLRVYVDNTDRTVIFAKPSQDGISQEAVYFDPAKAQQFLRQLGITRQQVKSCSLHPLGEAAKALDKARSFITGHTRSTFGAADVEHVEGVIEEAQSAVRQACEKKDGAYATTIAQIRDAAEARAAQSARLAQTKPPDSEKNN